MPNKYTQPRTEEEYRHYTLERIEKNVIKNDDPNKCWGWKGTKKCGGGAGIKYKGKMKPAYRILYMLYNNCELTKDMYILHSCDNRECCNPLHLRVGTPAENSKDMTDRKRNATGEKHGMARLTNQQVREIRIKNDLYNKSSYNKLAKEYNVCRNTIYNIVTFRYYTDV